MADKIHLKGSKGGLSVCAMRYIGNGKVRANGRLTYSDISSDRMVNPDEFRATPAANRCSHCSDMFTETMNRRRKLSGKPLYKDAFLKTF